jgi:hypothetical protein
MLRHCAMKDRWCLNKNPPSAAAKTIRRSYVDYCHRYSYIQVRISPMSRTRSGRHSRTAGRVRCPRAGLQPALGRLWVSSPRHTRAADLKFLQHRGKLAEELQIQSRTTRLLFASVPFDSEVRIRGVRQHDANFGIGTLVTGARVARWT